MSCVHGSEPDSTTFVSSSKLLQWTLLQPVIFVSARCIFRKMRHSELLQICKLHWRPQGSKSWASSKIRTQPCLVWESNRYSRVQLGPSLACLEKKSSMQNSVYCYSTDTQNCFLTGYFYLSYFYLFTNKQSCLIHPMLMTFKPVSSAGLCSAPRFSSGITERNVKDFQCIIVYLL